MAKSFHLCQIVKKDKIRLILFYKRSNDKTDEIDILQTSIEMRLKIFGHKLYYLMNNLNNKDFQLKK